MSCPCRVWIPIQTLSNGEGERYDLPQELTDNLNRSLGGIRVGSAGNDLMIICIKDSIYNSIYKGV